MASITIDRKRYSASKASATWLDKWIEDQVKEQVEVKKTIGEKEVTSKKYQIVPAKLFDLIRANGLSFPKAEEAVQNDQQGAVGRARMIFAGVIKRRIADGHELKNVDGSTVEQSEEFLAYKASLPVKAAKPEAAATLPPPEGVNDEGGIAAVEAHQGVGSDIG